MTIESRVDTKDLDKSDIRQLEIIAEKASLKQNKEREKYVHKAFDYINHNIRGEQGKYKQMYVRLFYDMVREYDNNHKMHIEEKQKEEPSTEKWTDEN